MTLISLSSSQQTQLIYEFIWVRGFWTYGIFILILICLQKKKTAVRAAHGNGQWFPQLKYSQKSTRVKKNPAREQYWGLKRIRTKALFFGDFIPKKIPDIPILFESRPSRNYRRPWTWQGALATPSLIRTDTRQSNPMPSITFALRTCSWGSVQQFRKKGTRKVASSKVGRSSDGPTTSLCFPQMS